jgi:hypothetical protein
MTLEQVRPATGPRASVGTTPPPQAIRILMVGAPQEVARGMRERQATEAVPAQGQRVETTPVPLVQAAPQVGELPQGGPLAGPTGADAAPHCQLEALRLAYRAAVATPGGAIGSPGHVRYSAACFDWDRATDAARRCLARARKLAGPLRQRQTREGGDAPVHHAQAFQHALRCVAAFVGPAEAARLIANDETPRWGLEG